MSAALDEAELRKERLEHSRKNLPVALLIFAIPCICFIANFVGILALGWPWGLLLSFVGAWLTGMLFIVGHDACHQSFTASRALNNVLGRIAFLPSLHNFSLWDLGHNRIHHRFNNVQGFDYVWEPMSPAGYAGSSRLQRAIYRFFRSGLGVPFYYAPAIWFPKMFLVRRSVYGDFRRTYLWDGILVWSFLALELVAAVAIGNAFGRQPIEAIVLAVVVPFVIWNALMSFVIYLHHTHPDVPWYRSVEEWRARNGTLTGTVHVRFPWLLRKLMLDIMEHNAHHYAPGVVPLYHLSLMQGRPDAEQVIEWRFGLARYFSITGTCRLFDFDAGRWVDYPTSAEAPQQSR